MTPNHLQSQNGRWIGNKLPSPFVLEKLLTVEVRGSKNSLQLVDYLGAHPMFLMSPTQSLLQVNQKGVRSNGYFAISFTKNESGKRRPQKYLVIFECCNGWRKFNRLTKEWLDRWPLWFVSFLLQFSYRWRKNTKISHPIIFITDRWFIHEKLQNVLDDIFYFRYCYSKGNI